MAKKNEGEDNSKSQGETRKFNSEQRAERNSAREFAKEYADLLREQNQELGARGTGSPVPSSGGGNFHAFITFLKFLTGVNIATSAGKTAQSVCCTI